MTPASRNQSAHHEVVSLRVTGGFLAGARLDFADGLNCLIGGRGTGKTTALEFLRFGLGLMPDPKTNQHRYRAIEGLVRANLGNGRLTIEVRTKTDMRYVASRGAHETVQVLNEAGTAVPISFDRDQIFGADVFSQNEIEEIASSPAAQLELLDRFREHETIAIARELEQLHRQLDQSSRDLLNLDQELDDARGRASELPVLQERLKGLAESTGPDASRINAAHAARSERARQAKVPEALAAAVQKLVRELRSSQSAFQTTVNAHLASQTPEAANRDLFEDLRRDLDSFTDRLETAVRSVEEEARAVEARIRAHEVALAERHALQEADYRAVVAVSEEETERAAERQRLQAALTAAQAASSERLAKEQQRQGLVRQRAQLLKRSSELHDQRFAIRKQIAERLTSQFPSIRVTVSQAADLDAYQGLVTDFLKGRGVKQGLTAERLCQAFLPGELAEVLANEDLPTLIQRSGFEEDRAKKVMSALRADGTHYTIETVALDDRPSIELLDGDTFKESTRLSTGQRCTTILPILLTQSERPLLIDQPEDNLDNAFVYENIVRALRDIKGTRQVIFVTHNPNIPVLGDAERVFVFSSDGQHATLKQAGTVDDCKDQIERILEGGRDAFLRRKARYGY
ncbi:MAG TPA: AAA family ATPase [Thermoanaerobaculia bacterium]|nr:AAA family ATPase [Thermoanaerobaculia bacterium]